MNGQSLKLNFARDREVLSDPKIFECKLEVKLNRLTPEEIAKWTKSPLPSSRLSKKLQIVYKSDTEMGDTDSLSASPSKKRKKPNKSKSIASSQQKAEVDTPSHLNGNNLFSIL
jgi:hypothetical protein